MYKKSVKKVTHLDSNWKPLRQMLIKRTRLIAEGVEEVYCIYVSLVSVMRLTSLKLLRGVGALLPAAM